MDSTRGTRSVTDIVVGPRMRIPEGAELRMRVDVDPEGNRAIRVEQYLGSAGGLQRRNGPLWINPSALNGTNADFCF